MKGGGGRLFQEFYFGIASVVSIYVRALFSSSSSELTKHQTLHDWDLRYLGSIY